MLSVSELEAIIAETPPGEQVQYETRLIGSVDDVTRKPTVGVDRFGECFLAAFSTIGDPLEFRARHLRAPARRSTATFPAAAIERNKVDLSGRKANDRRSEKMSLILGEGPPMAGFLRIGYQSPSSEFGHFRGETPKVSGYMPKYSHFRETATGDRV